MELIKAFNDDIILENFDILCSDEISEYKKLESIPTLEMVVASAEFKRKQELHNDINVQIYNDFVAIRDIVSRPCNDIEWASHYENIEIGLDPAINRLPIRFMDANLRAWLYIQLVCIQNNKASDIGLTPDKIEKLRELHLRILAIPELADIHVSYLAYYAKFLEYGIKSDKELVQELKLSKQMVK